MCRSDPGCGTWNLRTCRRGRGLRETDIVLKEVAAKKVEPLQRSNSARCRRTNHRLAELIQRCLALHKQDKDAVSGGARPVSQQQQQQQQLRQTLSYVDLHPGRLPSQAPGPRCSPSSSGGRRLGPGEPRGRRGRRSPGGDRLTTMESATNTGKLAQPIPPPLPAGRRCAISLALPKPRIISLLVSPRWRRCSWRILRPAGPTHLWMIGGYLAAGGAWGDQPLPAGASAPSATLKARP